MKTETQNETPRDQIEMTKLVAEIMNLLADMRKKQAETSWHPLVVGAAILAAGAALAKLFLS